MSDALLSDTGLALAAKTYTPFQVFFKHRLCMAQIVLHTSATAGTRRVQMILRPTGPNLSPPVGHGLIIADTGPIVATGATVSGVGGPTNAGTEAAPAVLVQWFQTIYATAGMVVDIVATLIAGDTYDLYLSSFDSEDGEE